MNVVDIFLYEYYAQGKRIRFTVSAYELILLEKTLWKKPVLFYSMSKWDENYQQ